MYSNNRSWFLTLLRNYCERFYMLNRVFFFSLCICDLYS